MKSKKSIKGNLLALLFIHSGIMDPARIAAIFERTKSLYRILADSQLKKKLRFPDKKVNKKPSINIGFN